MNSAQKKGKACERTKIKQSKKKGCRVIPTGTGSDFLEMCAGKVPTLVEVKARRGSLTPKQRTTKRKAMRSGFGYRIERCLI